MIGFAGLLIFCMICLSILGDITAVSGLDFVLYAGICGWIAVGLLLPTVGRLALVQAGIIAFSGVILLLIAQRAGNEVSYASVISKNSGLVAMIASVGFLRLIALKDNVAEPLPIGVAAYFKTVLGISVFGSVINISAPILFADRLHSENRLTRLASSTLTRVFSGCSSWSPFFGGMAVILIYVPDVQLSVVMLICLPFALVGLLVVCLEGWWYKRQQLRDFRGYPVKFASLWIPLCLSLLVIVLTVVAPDWSILTCISLSAIGLTIVILLLRYGLGSTKRLSQHIFFAVAQND